jgi:hypothetical protein
MTEARMLSHPGSSLSTVVAGEVVGDDENVTDRIVGFDLLKQSKVVGGVAGGGTAGEFLAITYAQGSIDPGFLGSTAIIQWSLDAVSIGGPARGGREGAWDHWSKFIGADGRRSLCWRPVVGDDRCSFGAKSSSELLPQLWVRRQRTPSRSKIVRI